MHRDLWGQVARALAWPGRARLSSACAAAYDVVHGRETGPRGSTGPGASLVKAGQLLRWRSGIAAGPGCHRTADGWSERPAASQECGRVPFRGRPECRNAHGQMLLLARGRTDVSVTCPCTGWLTGLEGVRTVRFETGDVPADALERLSPTVDTIWASNPSQCREALGGRVRVEGIFRVFAAASSYGLWDGSAGLAFA